MRREPFLRWLSCLLAACLVGWSTPPPGTREAYAAQWQAQGLRAAKTRLDLFYVRPGVGADLGKVQVAPVDVRMRKDWQRDNGPLERVRLRPEEERQLKDEVAAIVADELAQAFAGATPAAGEAPVLQARVVDLYLNAPDIRTGMRSQSYTNAYGDMVLVAELRDAPGGKLLLASWDHRPAREFATPRLTTRVENAVELRAAARTWARLLRRETDRLGKGD
jgi:hypothetical protein